MLHLQGNCSYNLNNLYYRSLRYLAMMIWRTLTTTLMTMLPMTMLPTTTMMTRFGNPTPEPQRALLSRMIRLIAAHRVASGAVTTAALAVRAAALPIHLPAAVLHRLSELTLVLRTVKLLEVIVVEAQVHPDPALPDQDQAFTLPDREAPRRAAVLIQI